MLRTKEGYFVIHIVSIFNKKYVVYILDYQVNFSLNSLGSR